MWSRRWFCLISIDGYFSVSIYFVIINHFVKLKQLYAYFCIFFCFSFFLQRLFSIESLKTIEKKTNLQQKSALWARTTTNHIVYPTYSFSNWRNKNKKWKKPKRTFTNDNERNCGRWASIDHFAICTFVYFYVYWWMNAQVLLRVCFAWMWFFFFSLLMWNK